MQKTTCELLEILQKSSNLTAYMQQVSEDLIETVPLHIYLEKLLHEKNLKKSDVIRLSGLDRGYAYDIFSGSKLPSRNKVLALCFSMSLLVTEVQRLLVATGYSQLYARLERDSIILFALQRQLSLIDTNELLFEMGYPCLM